MKQTLLTFVLAVLCGFFLEAQLVTTLPQVSPKAKVYQTVGLTDIAIVYHSPAVKDREIWGKLVPYGQIWRAGANENTVFYTSDDIEVEGAPLKAGKYGLHMIPGEDNWTVIFSKDHTSWGSFNYDMSDDALRVQVEPVKTPTYRENLNFSFDNVNVESATWMLQWENIQVPVQISVNTHDVVLASLREELKVRPGFSWIGWHEAARYCQQNEVNVEEGAQWAARSVFMNPNAQNIITKAKLAGMSKKEGKDAKTVMAKSLENDLDANAVTWREYQAAAKFAENELSDKERAMAWIDRSIDMHPNMTNMMTKVAMLEGTGDTKAAGKLKEKALQKGSNGELNNYGYQLLFAGKTAEAVEVFKINADKHPNDPNVWDSLGEGYHANGQNEKAIESLKKSLSMDPPANVKANSIRLLGLMGVEYEPGT